jgi:cytochrome P450
MSTIDATRQKVPDHVPPELFWDRQLQAFNEELDDPFLAASRLHQGPDVFWARDSGHGRPAWVITRHHLIQEAFVDYEHFTSEDSSGINSMLGVAWRPVPLDYDPPQHTLYRQVLNPFFTPKKINELEAAVRTASEALISKFADRRSCEFIEEYATPFPTYIFLALMGLPAEEAAQFLAWERGMMRAPDPMERIGAAQAVAVYLEDFVRRQRAKPTTDLLAGILDSKVGDRPITDEEVLGALYTLYTGGLDTVYSSLGWIFRHLATHPELQSQLRADLQLIPAAVDDLLRAFSVVSTRRRVAKDHVFHGVQMRAGDLVVLPLYLAARDPAAHEAPHEIRLGRTSGRLTFASGPHHCVGAHLARREVRVTLEAFLSRFRNIQIPAGESYAYHAGVVFGVDRLPLAWEDAQSG